MIKAEFQGLLLIRAAGSLKTFKLNAIGDDIPL